MKNKEEEGVGGGWAYRKYSHPVNVSGVLDINFSPLIINKTCILPFKLDTIVKHTTILHCFLCLIEYICGGFDSLGVVPFRE